MSIENTLAERGSRYGDFTDHAKIAQAIQDDMRIGAGWSRLDDVKRQALTVIADKIARILSGDPNYADNWHDIQGYAKLVEDRLPSHHVDPADVEIASAIDDSARMQAIGQNGNGGEHYGAPDWSNAPDNAVLYIDWTGSAAGFDSSFYCDGGDRFYRLHCGVRASTYVLKRDDGLPDTHYQHFMRPAN